MDRKHKGSRPKNPTDRHGIVELLVEGFKSICNEQRIAIRPITILAGANSSGKSSMLQPLLLLKQTLEAPYDPGALLLSGPNVKFTSANLLFFSGKSRPSERGLRIGVKTAATGMVVSSFQKGDETPIELSLTEILENGKRQTLSQNSDSAEFLEHMPADVKRFLRLGENAASQKLLLKVQRNRCFFEGSISTGEDSPYVSLAPGQVVAKSIREIIHLPGLRGNPERTYPVTAVGSAFPGTFETYTASVISKWESERNELLGDLNKSLTTLGLTWKVSAKRVSDTTVEMSVGRLPRAVQGGAHDLVNIADVGFGVSQSLPFLVAIHAAREEQLVYVEQPEMHLHPKAQYHLAAILADAALKKKRMIIETHSALLLLGLQALIAEGQLPCELVQLHWFQRDKDGVTVINSAEIDETGAFGNWPEDFAEVTMEAENRYLNAAEARHAKG